MAKKPIPYIGIYRRLSLKVMSFDGAMFPPLTPRISDLYGASGGAFRTGEADAYAQDLDELEREERALETMIQELVHRQAAVPIGVKFHREGMNMIHMKDAGGCDVVRSTETAQNEEIPLMRSSSSEEEGEEEDEEDEAMEDDEAIEDEEEMARRLTLERGGEWQARDDEDNNESGLD
ncbi:hypothetical protein PsorP6_012559 [Peronosclerospora sorghi]|uniref:Uncharacterized protein n=1 Tax=Peronosclerospora sorghi TaxID=230839 RepID=A0ACC0WFS6_9STRA|nr:hypothetical protein PsorP6_012559 [Peronosclerospora sorghi]